MNDPNETVANEKVTDPTIDAPSFPVDSLDVGLAAGFGRATPRSSLGFQQKTVLLKEAEGESSLVVKTQSDAMPTREEAGDRYRLDGEIARGGMGAVLRGRDVDLGRDLAVKVLLDRYANNPDVARRFIEEAQIGGQLQHPGVVPVYDIGRFGDRPYFTMKLVKGQTLAAILSERTDAGTDRPPLLNIALQVSQAMAYAHAKGVIHRDLKPANIMVGAFGEVQVMDWGLAKVLGEGGVADEERAGRAHQEPEDVTTIRTARSTGSFGSFGTDTEAGSILGTPAYMPPEQASGDIPNLDRRADVFALGAILCEILTGKPPYVGRSSEEVRRKAANGDLADATSRLNTCGADADLIAVTKKCLAPEAIDRPKDAQAVVDSLTSYLDGVQERLQAAERERAVAVVRETEQRKRRRVQIALAAAVVGLVLGGGSFAWWQTDQANQRRETDLRRQLADEQRAADDKARLARNAEAVSTLLSQCEEALRAGDAAKAAVALDAARKRSGEGGAAEQAKHLALLEADLALSRELDGVDQFRWTWSENQFPDQAIVAARTREALKRFGADPDAVSVDDATAKISKSVVRERIVSALDRLLLEPIREREHATLRKVDGDPYRDAVRGAIAANDRSRFGELVAQDKARNQPPGFAAFLGSIPGIQVERRRQLLESAIVRRSGNLNLLMAMAETYLNNEGESSKERLRWYQAAIAAAPANAAAYTNLGFVLWDIGQPNLSVPYFKKAIELDPELAPAYSNLGMFLAKEKQDYDGAITCFRKAIDLDPKYAFAYSNLGNALRSKGRRDEAIECHKKAVELDPKRAELHANLGNALKEEARFGEAIAEYNKAIELNPRLARVHSHLAPMLYQEGRWDEAIACLKKAIELDPAYAEAYSNMGTILCDAKKDYDGAITCFRKAIELDPKSAVPYSNLGNALFHKGQLDEAIRCYKKAIELDPAYAEAHCYLGDALAKQARFAESLTAYKNGHEVGSKRPGWSLPSGEWVQQAELRAAMELKLAAFLKGDRQLTDNAERLALAEICQIKKLNHAAVGLYAAAFAADPKLADDLKSGHRYNAACFAALAAAGQDEDAAKLDAKERAALRKKALDWLRADLDLWTKQLDSAIPADRTEAQQALLHWKTDPDLAGVRDAAALAKLPKDEQNAFTQLWDEVETLLKRAKAK